MGSPGARRRCGGVLATALLTSVNPLAATVARAEEGFAGVEGAAVLRVVLGLALVIFFIFALAWFLRRYSGAQQTLSGEMRVLGSLSVGQRERVVLVQIGEQQLLLGVAPGRVQTLHVLERPLSGAGGAEAAPRDVQSDSFAERLRRLMQQPNKQ